MHQPTPEETLEYLDGCIRHWREIRDSASIPKLADMAICYIDAFQSARITLFGEVLPEEPTCDYCEKPITDESSFVRDNQGWLHADCVGWVDVDCTVEEK